MINFIIGRSGSGKSKRLKEILLNEINSGEKTIFIVPEQSSFENEKNLLLFLGNKNFAKTKVLSFSRLFDFASEILKIPPLKVSDETTQIILMNEVLEELKGKLRIYKKSSNDTNLAKLILETLGELKSHKIDKKVLKKIYETCDKNILKQKIKEIINISDLYETIVQDAFKDSFDELNVLDATLRSNKLFEDYSIFFDEFSTFTAQQLSIIETMMTQAKTLHMAFCTDKLEYDPCSIFSHVNKTIFKIKNIAKLNSVKLGTTELIEGVLKFQNPDLQELEKNLFNPQKNFSKFTPKNINIYNAKDPNDECEYIAQRIKSLIIEKGYRYSDFTILTRDICNYVSIFASVFKRYNIPYFIDAPEKLFNKNLLNLIFSAFDSVHSDYSPMDILRYLKTGLIGLSNEEISNLENYILLWNIKSDSWNMDFNLHPEGFYKELDETYYCVLMELNKSRKKVITPLENFKSKIKNSTGKEISKAIYDLLLETNTAENLKDFCDNLEKYGDFQAAERYALFWDKFMDVLNQIAVIIGDKKISSQKYLEVLTCAIDSVDCSYIPPSMDNVTVADAARTRITNAKVVFIVGATNGDFPMSPNTSEIFTDEEVNHIASLGIEIKDNSESFLIKERFLAYTSLTAPSEKLFVSWASIDLFKKSKLPSEIIKEVKMIFPNIKVFSRKDFSDVDMIFSKSSAFEVYLKNQDNFSLFKTTLKHYLYSDATYKKRCEATEKFRSKSLLKFQNGNSMVNLFDKNITLSASQIERYHICSFAYFCEYGLKVKPRALSNFDSLDYGTLVHFLLEKIFKKYSKNEIENLPSDLLTSEVSKILNEYVEKNLGGWENKSKSFTYLISRVKTSIQFLIKHFSEEFKQSEFKVFDTEIEISKFGKISPLEFVLNSGVKVFVEGKIDRADVMTCQDLNYIRIIDYKTGAKNLKLSDVYYGISMQMLIYLLAIYKNGVKGLQNIMPAAALYFTALKPLLDVQGVDDLENAEKEIRKKLKMNGLILKDPKIIFGMEKDANGEFIPAVIKDGKIKNSDSLITLDQLETIYNHIKTLVINMVTNVSCGKISANPIYLKNSSACKWCKYFPICRYEDENFFKIPAISNEKTLEKMKKEEDTHA